MIAKILAFAMMFTAIIIAIYLFQTMTAHAHDAPAGWSYPWSCCSSMDCQHIDSPRVHETPGGYVVDGSTDDAPIGYQDKRVKDSPDGEFHWCAHQSGPDAGNTICLFRPAKGF